RVLDRIDGVRTAAEVMAECTKLDPPLSEKAALDLLAAIDGELIERVEQVESAGSPAASSIAGMAPATGVAILGSGLLARRIERELKRAVRALAPEERIEVRRFGRSALPDLAAIATSGASLLICALEGVPYGRILAVQAALLATGMPALFLTADPDGMRIGPTVLPGVGPCFACAQLAAIRFTRLDSEAALAAVAGVSEVSGMSSDSGFSGFRAETASPDERAWAASAAAQEALEVVRGRGRWGEPELIEAFLWRPPAPVGTETRRIPLERDPDCPLCSGISAPPSTAVAARAEITILKNEEQRPPRAISSAAPGERIRSVGILGGGTAGYLTALALRRKAPDLAVTLVESPDLPILGVGEATTPLMPQFLHVDLGLDVHRLFAEVRPTLKLGIRFLWGEPGNGDFNYP